MHFYPSGMDHETMTPFVAWGAGIRPLHDHSAVSFEDFLGSGFADFQSRAEAVRQSFEWFVHDLLGMMRSVNRQNELCEQ